MCGFIGFVDPSLDIDGLCARARLKQMSGAIVHRGPDAEGVVVEEVANGTVWAGLAHRRLSIIDLSEGGAQPMASLCGRYVLAYNGEIYNFRDLRADLEARGVTAWRGHSDTEVLLEGMVRDGVAPTLAKVDGMFAFALVDRVSRTVTLARDAFGEKPLAYGIWNGVLLFGSELRALRTWPGFAPDEEDAARAALMQYGYIPAPLTIHKGIFKLPPAHLLEISLAEVASGRLPTPHAWWDMAGAALKSRANSFTGDFNDAIAAVEATLARSVERRMVSDVPLGALLSGGIDSSLTAALMQRASSVPVRTFTIGMQEDGYDESPHAAAVARHLGTRHETLMLSSAEVLEAVPRIGGLYDEPFGDSSQLPTYLVSRMARAHVSVALSGDGGDELFAGYNRHFLGPRIWSQMQRFPLALRVAAGWGLGSIPPDVLTALVRVAGSRAPRDLAAGRAGEKLHKLARLLGARDRDAYQDRLLRTGCASTVLDSGTNGAVFASASDPRLVKLDFASAAMLLDTGHYLHDDVLTKVDRASMAVSLETRTPFLNRELFELAWSFPHDFKVQRAQGKRVLRELLYQHIPREIVDRPKAGFAMPIGRWLRGPLREWAESLLSDSALRQSDVFNVGRVRALWHAHRGGRLDHEAQLWSVLMYQSWRASTRDTAQTRCVG